MTPKQLRLLVGIGSALCAWASSLGFGADWVFQETIVDEAPLQPHRITDVEIVDIDNDGQLDLWFSGSKVGRDERKFAWYEQAGSRWRRHTPFPGPSLGGNWGDVDGDGDVDLITGQDRNGFKTGNHALVWMENPLSNNGDPAREVWAVHEIHPDPVDPDELHTDYVDADGKKVRRLDLNRDGRLDLVIAAFKQTLWYVPGPEDPKKGPWRFYKIAERREGHGGAAVADIDRDGDLDIVWGHAWYENSGLPTAIPWRRRVIDAEWPNECKIAAGDLDKDGWLDVVLTGEEGSDGVAWYRNPYRDRRNVWAKRQVVVGWRGLHSCQLADFDKDGDVDIFTAQMHKRPEQRVAIFENADGRANRWATRVISNVGSHNAKVGDIDGDGDVDIAGKNYEDDFRPRVWLNPNDRTLSLQDWERHVINVNNPSRYTILGGDLNRDGRSDLVTGRHWYRNPGTPGGRWTKMDLPDAMGNALAVHDLDSDGDLDVFGEGLSLAINWGGGRFGLGANVAGHAGFVQGAAMAGWPESLPLRIAFTYKNGDAVRLLTLPTRRVSGRWQDDVVYDWIGKSKCIDAGDIDRDGDVDIAFVGRDGPTIQWLRNDGGHYTPVDVADSPAPINHRCRLADLNGDGRLDLLVGHKGKLVTWFEQPASATSPWVKHVIAKEDKLAFDPLSLDAADMDRDGDIDVIVGEHTPKKAQALQCALYVFENADRAGGQWTQHLVHRGDEHHQGAHAVDIDGDGDIDIASVGWTHNRVLLYENKANPAQQ